MIQSFKRVLALGLACLTLFLSACAVMSSPQPQVALDKKARWALLPFANHTETPLAGQRAEAIAGALLHGRGVDKVITYPANLSQESLFDSGERKNQEQAVAWAKDQGARYAMTGAVDEWRYKVGVDGEPAVGVMLEVIDLTNGSTVWRSVGGRTGWSREGLAAVAQKLIGDLMISAFGI